MLKSNAESCLEDRNSTVISQSPWVTEYSERFAPNIQCDQLMLSNRLNTNWIQICIIITPQVRSKLWVNSGPNLAADALLNSSVDAIERGQGNCPGKMQIRMIGMCFSRLQRLLEKFLYCSKLMLLISSVNGVIRLEKPVQDLLRNSNEFSLTSIQSRMPY